MMDKRVYGVIGIVSRLSNWNADFTGYPKTLLDGSVFGSDKALKYPMKKMWESTGKKVLYIKSMRFSTVEKKKETSTILIPRSLRERYNFLFQDNDLKDAKKVLTNLMSAIDVKNFGATFAEEGCNIAITGAVQIGQGLNKYDGTEAEEQQILSPFRDSSKENTTDDSKEKGEAKNSTLGTKICSNEAHYFYPFVINPLAYRELEQLGVTDGYTEEDYAQFKEAALSSATSYATNAKVGCENEFAVFVETDVDMYLPNLSEYVSFAKDENTSADIENHIVLNKLDELLNNVADKIKSVEIYYNPYTTIIDKNVKNAKYFNILTK